MISDRGGCKEDEMEETKDCAADNWVDMAVISVLVPFAASFAFADVSLSAKLEMIYEGKRKTDDISTEIDIKNRATIKSLTRYSIFNSFTVFCGRRVWCMFLIQCLLGSASPAATAYSKASSLSMGGT